MGKRGSSKRGRPEDGEEGEEVEESKPQGAAAAPAAAAEAKGDNEGPSNHHTSADYYFDSYAHFGIHEEMLKDVVRTKTYQQAIYQNAYLFKDKTVLDVGCGTGILSLFAAKSGAKHVYAVECSDIALQAREIVALNGYTDKVTIVKGKVEEITLPVDKVDIIISEWMGYFLFYESMLDTVIHARDRWLKEDGLILPNKATVHVCGIEDSEYRAEKIDFWDEVYGFKMGCIKRLALQEPLVDCVASEQIATSTAVVKAIDIEAMRKEDATFKGSFEIKARSDMDSVSVSTPPGPTKATRDDFIHALVAHFDIQFTRLHKPLGFSTGPRARQTHWKQTVFYLENPIAVKQGETVRGEISCRPNARNPRDLDVEARSTTWK